MLQNLELPELLRLNNQVIPTTTKIYSALQFILDEDLKRINSDVKIAKEYLFHYLHYFMFNLSKKHNNKKIINVSIDKKRGENSIIDPDLSLEKSSAVLCGEAPLPDEED